MGTYCDSSSLIFLTLCLFQRVLFSARAQTLEPTEFIQRLREVFLEGLDEPDSLIVSAEDTLRDERDNPLRDLSGDY